MSESEPEPENDALPEDTNEEPRYEKAEDPETEADPDPGPAPAPPDGEGGDIMSFIGNGGIRNLLLQDRYEDETGHTFSQADLVADVINVMRMDAKQMGALHGVDIEVQKMSPERAATLLEGLATQDSVDIIEVFQDIEDHMDQTFQTKMTPDQHAQYMAFKEEMLYTVNTGGEQQ